MEAGLCSRIRQQRSTDQAELHWDELAHEAPPHEDQLEVEWAEGSKALDETRDPRAACSTQACQSTPSG